MFSVLWLLYMSFISALFAFFTYALFFRKGKLHDSTPAQEKINYLKKLLPPSGTKGWQLKTIDNGLRVWQKNMGSNSPSWMPGTIYACSGIIPASQQDVTSILKQPGLLTEWDPGVKSVSKVTLAGNHDVISVGFNCSSIIARTVHQIRQTFGGELNAVYSRQWERDATANSGGWLMSSFIEQVIPAEGALWSCFFVSSIDNGDDEQSESSVTLIVAPVSPLFASIPQLTSLRVAGLQDFFTHYKPDTSPIKSCGSEASASTMSSLTTEDHTKDLTPLPPLTLPGDLEDGNLTKKTMKKVGSAEPDEAHLPDFVSSESQDNLLQKLNSVYEGTLGTDGWITVGNIKGVDIIKRPSKAGERPWDTLKGTSVVCVPVHYILAYIQSLERRGEWDDLFLKGEIVEDYDLLTKVTLTEFKPVWPASGRDFCNLAIIRELGEGVFCQAYQAAECEKCPEQRGLVRGEIIIGGFVIKELSSDPPRCLVTYITRVDLKGNLPARIVNRVTSSQPQAVAVLRDKLEALYQADVASSSEDVSDIQRKGVEIWTELMKAKEARFGTAAEGGADSEEKESMLEWSLVEKHRENGSIPSSSDTQSVLQASNLTDSRDMFPIPDDNMQLAHEDRHLIDFKTLGSQAAANLVGEVLLASKVEISMSEELSELASTERDWSYHSIEKDVVILRKISPGEKIHSFLGKGMIKVKPPAVWQAVRNHMTRHVYDKMLKKTKLVRQIDEQTKIVYLHHETTQCFVKQSRDFVILASERVEPERYILAGVSVDLPEIPPTREIVRGKVYSSGWIIEPMLQNGQLYSMVSYLSQVNFGGAIPTRVLNVIARRQPLCIAYLRGYLEKFENK